MKNVVTADMLDELSDEPIYQQIVSKIKSRIMSGQLKNGDALPSIRSLATEFRVSTITTVRVYKELEKEGFVLVVPNKGVFVNRIDSEFLQKKCDCIFVRAYENAKSLGFSLNEIQHSITLIYEKTKCFE